MVSFPYHSHIFRDSYGSGMGIVWEASHKGVPLLGVPGITLEHGDIPASYMSFPDCKKQRYVGLVVMDHTWRPMVVSIWSSLLGIHVGGLQNRYVYLLSFG